MQRVVSILALFFTLGSLVAQDSKITCYAWMTGPGRASDEKLLKDFMDLKQKGIDGLMYSAGQNPERYRRIGKLVKQAGMEFHAWIPTLIQGRNRTLKPEWYAINGRGESAYDKPAYVRHYKFLCPNREEVYDFLSGLYGQVADIPEVDGIHLDFIRFPDVILARGLWEKYDLVMDREYPQYDYCYCDQCVGDFQEKTGINIRSEPDPSQIQAWKQFRYDLITNLVNHLAKEVHAKNKQINAAVFPGPHSIAKKIVRQEWDKWDLDAFFPMNYNDFYLEGTDWIGDVCAESVASLPKRQPVFSGLFICPRPEKKSQEPDPEYHGLTPEELPAAIRESIQNGASGICLFMPSRMTAAHWKEFENVMKSSRQMQKN